MSARSKFSARVAQSQPKSVFSTKDSKGKKALNDIPALSPATCGSLARLWQEIAAPTGKGPLPSPFDPNSPCSAPWALNIVETDEGGQDMQAMMKLSQPASLFCFRVLEAVIGGRTAAIRPSDAVFLAAATNACIKALRTKSAEQVEEGLVTVALAHQRAYRLSASSMDALERALISTMKRRFSADYIAKEDVEKVCAAGCDYLRKIIVPKKGKVAECLVM